MSNLPKLVSDLQFAYSQPNRNSQDASNLFKKFQIALIKSYNSLQKEEDFIAAAQGLEYGAQLCIDMKNGVKFERVIQQLSQFYSLTKVCDQSQNRQFLIGLYLMYLLTKNRLDDFHTELELLSENDLKNEFILFSMNIETYLMDGSYNKILGIKAELANKNDSRYDKFEMFLNDLQQTVRDEIADSLESVHETMPIKDVLTMLKLDNVKTLQQWIKQQNAQAAMEMKEYDDNDIDMAGDSGAMGNKRNWTLNKETVVFEREEQQQQAIDAMDTAKDMLEFTGHIETIV